MTRTRLSGLGLLVLIVALVSCTQRGRDEPTPEPDDDDATDDDDFGPDDDDVTRPDDDDFGTDDDDFGTDDDDFGTDDDDFVPPGDVTVIGEYRFEYYIDLQNGIPWCTQVMQFTGSASFGPDLVPDCIPCTGRVDFAQGSFVDVSNPAVDPDHCDPATLQAQGTDYGVRMTDPADYGDFSDVLGLIDSDSLGALGLDMTTGFDTDSTAAGREAEYSQFGLDFTHGGFVNADATSLAGSAGLEQITRPPTPGSGFLAAWDIYLDPTANSYSGPELVGPYAGDAMFVLYLSEGGTADGLYFSFTLTATP